MAQALSARAINQRKKKTRIRTSVTYSTDRENKVSKIFIVSLRLSGTQERKLSNLAGRIVKYDPQT